MILDARNPDVSLNRTTELAIVGAGPAGLVLARELSEFTPVLLIESGGVAPDPQVAALQEGESTGIDYPLTETRSRGFGGSSSLWAGYCAQFDPHDFAPRPWVADSGWPFGAEELTPYYSRAAKLLNLGHADFDARAITARAGSRLPLDGRQLAPTLWRFGTPIQRFGESFQTDFASSSTITTLTHATVADIRLGAGLDHVAELEIRTLNGRRGHIRPAMVVLACGGLETPRILLNANRQLACGLGNGHDLVGRYFMEHPHFTIDAFELLQPDAFADWTARGCGDDGLEYLSCLGLNGEAQQQLGVLNARLHLYRTPAMAEDAAPRAGLFMEQAPNPNSRVTLSEQADALGNRRLRLHWRLSELDRLSFVRTAQALAATFERKGRGRAPGPSPVAPPPLYSNHHLGTTRMAESRHKGVVDPNSKVHGIRNLYISGGSVFPTVSWANPTFTLMALTYRLADHLQSLLRPGCQGTPHDPKRKE